MIAAPLTAETDLRARHRARLERHMAAMEELAAIGMAVARALGERAVTAAADGAAGDGQGPDPGLALSRIARCVRQTAALEVRLSERLLTQETGGGDGMSAMAEAAAGAAARVRRMLAPYIDAAPGRGGDEDGDDEDGGGEDDEPAEGLDLEARERLEDAAEDGEELDEIEGFELAAAGSRRQAAHGPPPSTAEDLRRRERAPLANARPLDGARPDSVARGAGVRPADNAVARPRPPP